MNERPQVPPTLLSFAIGAFSGFLTGSALVGFIWWLS
jgi:uncharacterized protein involved in exopolysaccharide biosynthesis